MNVIDVDVVRESPALIGSVQRMYPFRQGEREYLLCEAEDDGSVFDVGRFFVIPGSGAARNTLRHQIFSGMGSPGAWREWEYTGEWFAERGHLNGLMESSAMLRLRKLGMISHHIGAVDTSSRRVDHSVTAEPSPLVVIERIPLVKPVRTRLHGRVVYDYTDYFAAPSKIIGLEQIVRLGIPGGFQDTGGPESRDAARRLDLSGPLSPWSAAPRPLCDWQTKYEDHDRYLGPQEALYISGVTAGMLNEIGELLILGALFIDSLFMRGGLRLWDLKWEVALRDAEPVVVDTVDHDSMRVTHALEFDGMRWHVQFNKQAVRDYCKIFCPEWVEAVRQAKIRSINDSDGRPFREIYADGVTRGDYPPMPVIDPDFLQLQALKYRYVADVARGIGDLSVGQRLAGDEVQYYKDRDKLALLRAQIACG
jgi:phosphoribosylaminoimidazole-succinocarboxamide synthase